MVIFQPFKQYCMYNYCREGTIVFNYMWYLSVAHVPVDRWFMIRFEVCGDEVRFSFN